MRLIATAYLAGAVLDGVTALALFVPEVAVAVYEVEASITPERRYALGVGGSLMLGWTVLLVWGWFRPVERRGILVITIVPVLAGLAAFTGYAGATGLLAPAAVATTVIVQVAITTLLLVAYVQARTVARSGA
jgi:hypothetical protein